MGGIPLLYLGDETAMLNDYSYGNDPAKAGDSRWVHRPFADWQRMERRHDAQTLEGRVYQGLRRLIRLRQEHVALAGHDTTILDTGNAHVFGYVRQHGGQRVLALASFSEHAQAVAASLLRIHGLGYVFQDLVSGQAIALDGDVHLDPYQFVWLTSVS
jgi:amylosucrase